MTDLGAFGVDVPEADQPADEQQAASGDTTPGYNYSRPQCRALTAGGDGDRCANPVRRIEDAEFCPAHADVEDVATIDDTDEDGGGDA